MTRLQKRLENAKITAERMITERGFEDPKTIKAWEKYDKLLQRVNALAD